MTTEPPAQRRRPRSAALLAAAAATAMVLAPMAEAMARCTNDTDQVVFELEALKSELMVIATTCKGNNEDRYNDFIRRYRPALIESNRMLGQYFQRTRGGQRATDAWITELANARSNAARQLGGDFCARNPILFTEVMALPNITDLPAYAATKDLLSSGVTACPAGAAPAAAPSRTTSRR